MGILKRTAFASREGGSGALRFHAFNLVTTNDGVMVEPAQAIGNPIVTSYDPVDEINRIDEIRVIDFADRNNVINFGSESLIHGEGYQG